MDGRVRYYIDTGTDGNCLSDRHKVKGHHIGFILTELGSPALSEELAD